MKEDILKCPRCGGKSFFKLCKVTCSYEGRLTKNGFEAVGDVDPYYQGDAGPAFSYMCTKCYKSWPNVHELQVELQSKQ